MSAPAIAQSGGTDTSARPTHAVYLVETSLALTHVTSVDETLSPERYGGGGVGAGVRIARLGARWHATAGAGFDISSSLAAPRTSGGLPRVRSVALEARADLLRRIRVFPFGGTTMFAGLAIDGRYAERTHHLGIPAGASPLPLENSGRDYVVAVQPTIEVTRSMGSGAIADRLGIGAVAAVWHAWAPTSSVAGPVEVQAPPSLMQIDNLLTLTRSVGPHATVGLSYRLRLLRARSPILLAESRHDLAFTLGWRRGRTR